MAAQDSELPKLGHVAGLSVERVSSLKAVIGNVAILGGPLGGRNRPVWRCANARADGVPSLQVCGAWVLRVPLGR